MLRLKWGSPVTTSLVIGGTVLVMLGLQRIHPTSVDDVRRAIEYIGEAAWSFAHTKLFDWIVALVALILALQHLRELKEVTKTLQAAIDAVHTVPPERFLAEYCRQVTHIHTNIDLQRARTQQQPQAALAEITRRLLSAVALLAHAYDSRDYARYAANIMLFVPSEDKAPYFPTLDQEKLRRFNPSIAFELLMGVLVLIEELSVVAQPNGGPTMNKDTDLEQIIFGVLREDRWVSRNTQWKLLPGAPLAFAKWHLMQSQESSRQVAMLREAVQGHDDIRQIRKCNTEGINGMEFNLAEDVVEAIEAYYLHDHRGQKVRSFQSFPLVDSEGKAFGIVNVHCDQTTFLGPAGATEARKRQQIFAGIVSPLVFKIAEAADAWWSDNGKTIRSSANNRSEGRQ